MGLISSTIPVVDLTVINTDIPKIQSIVDSHVPIVVKPLVYADSIGAFKSQPKSLHKTIYHKLSETSELKVLQFNGKIKSEFDAFIKYAEDKTAGLVATEFDAIDEILGNLGINLGVSNGVC